MLPLNRVPGLPARVADKLAELGIDTAERLQRNLQRDDTRRELEQLIGPSNLSIAMTAVQRALGPARPAAEPQEAAESPAERAAREREEKAAARRRRLRNMAMGRPSDAASESAKAPAGRATAERAGRPSAEPVRAGRGSGGGVQDELSRLDSLRGQLTELSRTRWSAYLERARERLIPADARFERSSYNPYDGDYVILEGVDPTRQASDYDGRERVTLHPDRRYGYWVIEHDADLSAMVRLAREVQSEFGFSRDALWDAVCVFRKVSWCSGTLDYTKEDLPFVGLAGIFIQDQFAVFNHPQKGAIVPGLQAARAKAREIRGSVTLSDDAGPQELLGVLLRSLALNDLELFGKLWTSNLSERDMRYHFNQFDKAYAACNGNVVFERFDANQNPDNYPECSQVKMFVRRTNTDGSAVSRPLTFIQQGGHWKLYSGTI